MQINTPWKLDWWIGKRVGWRIPRTLCLREKRIARKPQRFRGSGIRRKKGKPREFFAKWKSPQSGSIICSSCSSECGDRSMVRKVLKSLSSIASQMGRKGGTAGKGKAKKRGNASYYRDMQRKAVASRLANAKARKSETT